MAEHIPETDRSYVTALSTVVQWMQRWADGTFADAASEKMTTYQISTVQKFSSLCSSFDSLKVSVKPLFADEKNADISVNVEVIQTVITDKVIPCVGAVLMREFDKPVSLLKAHLDLSRAIFDSTTSCIKDGSTEFFRKLVPYRAHAGDIAGAVESLLVLQVGEVETMRVQFLSQHHRVTLAFLDVFDPEFNGPLSALRVSEASVSALVRLKTKHDNYSSWYSSAAPKLAPVAADWVDVSGIASNAIALTGELMTTIMISFNKHMQGVADDITQTGPPKALVTHVKLLVDPTLQKTLDDP